MNDKKIYKALGRNVFVKEITPETKVGTFVIPDSLNADFTFGEVISVAEGYFDNGNFVPASVAIGDKIAFPRTAGVKITLNNQKLIRVFMEDIVAKEIDGEILEDNEKGE